MEWSIKGGKRNGDTTASGGVGLGSACYDEKQLLIFALEHRCILHLDGSTSVLFNQGDVV
ncbi:hypothetical protein LZ31DRAFT_551210 [Colletotrichum somersetense]|nr:hypothetical protein LZ31DRAFT_551210 [Colletotrichum somersetense]